MHGERSSNAETRTGPARDSPATWVPGWSCTVPYACLADSWKAELADISHGARTFDIACVATS